MGLTDLGVTYTHTHTLGKDVWVLLKAVWAEPECSNSNNRSRSVTMVVEIIAVLRD